MVPLSNKSEACQNAVDYLLFKFPPETGVIDDNATSPKFDDPIQIKNEVDDVAALPEVDSPIQLKEETEDGTASPSERDENEAKGEMFDPHLGTNYGYTELNVSLGQSNRSRSLSSKLCAIVNFILFLKGLSLVFLGKRGGVSQAR